MTERELTAIVKGVMPVLREELARDLAALTPKDGVNGRDGIDGVPGKDGVNGRDGIDGVPGKDGVNGRDGRDADSTQLLTLAAKVDTLQQLIPALTPRDGRDGKDGAPGAAGPVGPSGPSGIAGRDGVLKGSFVVKRLDPRRFQFCWADDGSPVTVVDAAGTPVDSVLRFPVPMHKGVWSDAAPYDEDDVVTEKGSLWIAKRATTSRPGEGASDWQLVVKRGSEGPRGKPGDPGPAGRDLTQMDFTGRKW
jgi:integrin beta 3